MSTASSIRASPIPAREQTRAFVRTFYDQMCGLEQVIWRVAEQELGARARKQRLVVQAVKELSEAYNRGLPPETFREPDLLANLVFFTVADMPKMALALAELALGGELPSGSPLRVLDVGAGCGGMTLGLLGLMDALKLETPLEVTALDSSTRAMELLAQTLDLGRREGVVDRQVKLTTRRQDLSRGPGGGGEADLILVGNLLNELPTPARLPLVRQLLARLAPGGHLVVVEPALKPTARDLHTLRDQLMAAGDATIFGPCTRKGPCPTLESDRDWCVEKRPWRPPPTLQRLIHATGLRRQNVTFSYLSLNRHGATAAGERGGAWRVVSKPLRSKGKRELFLCGEDGRLAAMRLNRHRSADNRPVEALRRGHLTWLEGERRKGRRLVVAEETGVEGLDPANPGQWMG